MHMADALISPAVGGTMWAATAAVATWSVRTLARRTDARRTALMAVAGAFVFAAQMINFSIPGTGSSGHLGAGFCSPPSWAPGRLPGHGVRPGCAGAVLCRRRPPGLRLQCHQPGSLRLSCRVPLIFRPIARRSLKTGTVALAGRGLGGRASAGAFGWCSRRCCPVGPVSLRVFVLLMQPIHLAIGAVEGLVTASVLAVLHRARPEVLSSTLEGRVYAGATLRP